jgi:hypothetical protein
MRDYARQQISNKSEPIDWFLVALMTAATVWIFLSVVGAVTVWGWMR